MTGNIDRREFIRSSVIKTTTGMIALNELVGPGLLGKGVQFVSAAERDMSASKCEIFPDSVQYQTFNDWSIIYTAGKGGLPLGWALVIRCLHAIEFYNNLTVTSSWSPFIPQVFVKNNVGVPRVIWIEPVTEPLPEGETITVTLEEYRTPLTTASCAFSILEMNPGGKEPEIGSSLTFMEVPAAGGKALPYATGRFNVIVPSRAALNEPVRIRIAAWDENAFLTPKFAGMVNLSANLPMKGLPGMVTFTAADEGTMTLEAAPLMPGTLKVSVTDGIHTGESNPCVVTLKKPKDRVFWGDYHKHSFHCDGHLFPEEIYDYARRSAFLDWGMISSHDMHPFPTKGARNWNLLHGATEAAHEKGEFITFQGYEWTHDKPFSPDDARGHKVILFLNPDHLLPLIPYYKDASHPEYMHPTTLIKRLKDRAGKDVIVIPHHLPLFKWWVFPEVDASAAGGPLPALTRSMIDEIQPVAEVYSRVHGNNESFALQNWIKPPTQWGWSIYHTFWQDGLMEGARTGAVCAGDNHYLPLGHPEGTALTAVLAPSLSRENIFRAIQNRRTYGTSGPRVFINFFAGEAKMGDIVRIHYGDPKPIFEVKVVSPLPIDCVEIVKVTLGWAQTMHTEAAAGSLEIAFHWEDPTHNPERWACYYLRVHIDNDAHGAWTSPIWFEPPIQEIPVDPDPRREEKSGERERRHFGN